MGEDEKGVSSGCGCLVVVAAVLMIVVVAWSVQRGPSGGVAASTRAPDKNDAIVMCRRFVDQRLKAPSRADHPILDVQAQLTGTREWTVRTHVDAPNGFGAMVRSHYTCTVQHVDGDQWRLVSLDIR